MRLRRLLITTTLLLCSAVQAAEDFVYVVQAGDHPWNIAQRFLKDTSFATRLAEFNRIPNDRRMQPGTELRIPAEWLRLTSTRVFVVATRGQALVITGAASRPAQAGEDLLPGSELRTADKASALLEFEDGSRVMLRQASELRLLRADQRLLDGGKTVTLELLRGGLENIVTPGLKHENRFEIRSPAAVAAVRGTRFRFNANAETSWTEVLEGAVGVSNIAGATQADAGFGTRTQAGRAPEPPRPLLAAPDLSQLPPRLERLPINWPLPEVGGAAGYRTQIAPDRQFTTLVSDEVTERPRARITDVPDGTYVMRVRAIDADGLEGLPSEHAIVVFARPQPPLLIEPELGSETASSRPLFRWTQPDPSWHYRLEVFREHDANTTALHAQTTGAVGEIVLGVDLAPGEYRWRMASIVPASGRQGPWGDTQTFRRVLPSPVIEPPVVEPGATTVRWPVSPHARSYELQLSNDGTFAQPLLEAGSIDSQYRMLGLTPGTYQLRLRAIAQDGYAGPWGQAQRFVVPEPPKPPEPDHWRALLLILPALLLFAL